jgi:hypothetical protein
MILSALSRTACAVALLAQLGMAGAARAYEIVSDEELEGARGGVMVAGDLTFENGALSLETQVTWAPDGVRLDRQLGDGVAAVGDAQLGGLTGAGDVFRTAGGALVSHRGADGQLVNMIVNTQSNLDLRQETAITLTLPGFQGRQADIGRQLMGLRFADDLAGGALSSLRR